MQHDVDPATARYLKRVMLYEWPEQVTLSYLTLPSQRADYRLEYEQNFRDELNGDPGRSMLLSSDSLTLTDSHKERFSRAIRILRLEPYVHPSQLKDDLSAFSLAHGYPTPRVQPPVRITDEFGPDELTKQDADIEARIEHQCITSKRRIAR